MIEKLFLLLLLFVPALSSMAQHKQQAKLLRKAFEENSTEMLFEFFDNWAKEVPSNEKKVVYLTKKYKKMLDAFLGDNHVDLGENNIMQPAFSKGDSRAKQQFIDHAAHIYYGHWGGYWQYETYPKAEQIIFNPEMNLAVVLFRFVYEGGQVILEKQNGEWTVVDTRFIWIE